MTERNGQQNQNRKGEGTRKCCDCLRNIRLPATIPPALLKASSERKIKKIHPFTQQDIVAEALTVWLQKKQLSDLAKLG